jgi:flagellar hook-associated protein 1 FlgK
MRSTFYGFEISKSGLSYNQKALDVTAHNVANAETKGYVRQRTVGTSVAPSINMSQLANLTGNKVGAGVNLIDIVGVRDTFLDRQFRKENSIYAEWQVKAETLSFAEDILREPSDTGINAILNQFFNNLEELSKNVGSKDIRTSFMEQAVRLTETIRFKASALEDIQKEMDFRLEKSVAQVNEYIKNIAALNEQIARFESNGLRANDLRDKRDLLLDQLSEYVGIQYREETVDGKDVLKVNMTIKDETGTEREIALIDHDKYFTFGTYHKTLPDGSKDFFHSLYIQDPSSGTVIDGVNATEIGSFSSGKLKGYMDMRDGDSEDNKGIPYYIRQLDTFVENFVEKFNEVHRSGWSYPNLSEGVLSQTGIDFFDPNGLTASTMRVNDAIVKNVYNIAGSSEEVNQLINSGNNENILSLLELRDGKNVLGSFDFEEYLRSVSVDLGTQAAYANNMEENEGTVLAGIDYKRQSVSGVDMDEEMTNMIRYEKAYQASARLMTALDEMLEILINKTGLVGR